MGASDAVQNGKSVVFIQRGRAVVFAEHQLT
jgi:hypothetical protein